MPSAAWWTPGSGYVITNDAMQEAANTRPRQRGFSGAFCVAAKARWR